MNFLLLERETAVSLFFAETFLKGVCINNMVVGMPTASNKKNIIMKKQFVQVDVTLLQDANLAYEEAILYSYIEGWNSNNEKTFISNARICKDLGLGLTMLNEYLKRLESKGLLKRWRHNNTRFLKALPYSVQQTEIQNTEIQHADCSQQSELTEFSNLNSQVQQSESAEFSNLTRYNNNYKNKNNNNYNQKEDYDVDIDEPLCVNNKKVTPQWISRYILGNGWGTTSGYKDLLCNLTNEELAQLETYLDKNRTEQYKDKVNSVIEQKLYLNAIPSPM